MKYIKHKFGFKSGNNSFVDLTTQHSLLPSDFCIFCCKEAKDIFEFNDNKFINILELELQNIKYLCLTEEEYIIKKLLE